MTDSVLAPRAVRDLSNLVGGGWRSSGAQERLESRNPATGELLARVPLSSAGDVDAAVRAARAALPAWRETPPMVRARAVLALRDVLVAHREELAELVTRDMGKTLPDARAEVGRGIESVEAAAAAPHLLKGETLPGVARGVDTELVHQPVGVVAAITPFNFPAMIPLWFLPYAIVCGNTVVLKPSEQDPLASVRIAELADGLEELPPGVVNLVNGGRAAVDALLDHPDVDAVSFVGSARTARYVASRAAAAGKRVQALGGAKNSLVLLPDADPQLTVTGVLQSAFGAAGQRCLAGSVAVVVGAREEQDAILGRIVGAARGLVRGDGADEMTDVCPLVAPAARERVEAAVQRALDEGAELLLDGRCGGGVAGAEMGPTVLEPVDEESELAREELFGPVLAVVRKATLEEAIAWANRSPLGNAAMLFTSSGGAAQRFREGIEAGMVGVNVGVAAPVAWFPFAGWKGSFEGDLHANGADAFRFYTRTKVVTSRWT